MKKHSPFTRLRSSHTDHIHLSFRSLGNSQLGTNVQILLVYLYLSPRYQRLILWEFQGLQIPLLSGHTIIYTNYNRHRDTIRYNELPIQNFLKISLLRRLLRPKQDHATKPVILWHLIYRPSPRIIYLLNCSIRYK